MNTEPLVSKTDVIEVFSFKCPICEDAVEAVNEAVKPCGCAVVERPWEEGPRELQASEGGMYPVPSLAVNGRVVFHGCPESGAWASPEPEEG